MGQGNFDFGEDPGGANVAKLCGNFLIMAAVEALGEAWRWLKRTASIAAVCCE